MADQTGTRLQFTPNLQLTPAGRHFGEAFCPSGDEACIREVGLGWERRVEEAFGFAPGQPLVNRQDVLGTNGTKLGTLTYADGIVTLCLAGTEPAAGPGRCRQVGYGVDGLLAVQQMLDVLGMSTQPAQPATGGTA